MDLEVTQVLRGYVHSGAITLDRGTAALDDLADFPLTRYPHTVLLPRIWQMRHSLTAYDAAYLALAEALNAKVVTRDRALSKFRSSVLVEVV